MTTFLPSHPDDDQTLLLTAGLERGDRAAEAWRRWRASHALDGIDQASFRLLPLVVRNPGVVDPADPLAGALLGLHRKTWIENRILFQKLGAALAALRVAGIAALALKGAALAAEAYDDPGQRPMSDADILVPEGLFVAAVHALEASGWTSDDPSPPASALARRHSVDLRLAGDKSATLDLHARPLAVLTPPSFAERLFADAESKRLGTLEILAPHPTHHLLLICAHGARKNAVGPARWVADATLLLRRRGPAVDWDRLRAEAAACRLVVPLHAALERLARHFGAPVPAAVLADLAARRPTWVERAERSGNSCTPSLVGDLSDLVSPWLRLAVRGRGWTRFAPPLAARTLRRIAWIPWKHGVRLPWKRLMRAMRTRVRATPKAHPLRQPGGHNTA